MSAASSWQEGILEYPVIHSLGRFDYAPANISKQVQRGHFAGCYRPSVTLPPSGQSVATAEHFVDGRQLIGFMATGGGGVHIVGEQLQQASIDAGRAGAFEQ